MAMFAAAALGQEVTSQLNRVANPGAESGSLSPWTGSGFQIGRYGSGPAPSTVISAQFGLGARYFAAVTAGGTVVQDVDFSDIAGSIDRPGYKLSASAYLGAAQGSNDDPTIVFQPLDAAGAPLGASTSIGPSTDADRKGQTVLVLCGTNVPAPVGTRRVRVTLIAGGSPSSSSAAVDRVSLEPARTPTPPSSGARARQSPAPASTTGCEAYSPPRAPLPASPAPMPPPPPPTIPSTDPLGPQTKRPTRLTAVRFGRSTVALRASRSARVRVTIERAGRSGNRGARRWKRCKTLTVSAVANKLVTRRFARLARGTYRLSARIAGQRTASVRKQRISE